MERRFAPLGQACDHNAVFALAYLRTTQTYEWASEQAGFVNDTGWVNHEDAVFAKYYFNAARLRRRRRAPGDRLLQPLARHERPRQPRPPIHGGGDWYRDAGWPEPKGRSRQGQREFLNTVVRPLLTELQARFDPSVVNIGTKTTKAQNRVRWSALRVVNIGTPYGIGYTGLFQTLAVWREQAWRNAELLVAAHAGDPGRGRAGDRGRCRH
jgi:hypothetical protein